MIKKPLLILALGMLPSLGWAQTEACSSTQEASSCSASSVALKATDDLSGAQKAELAYAKARPIVVRGW